MTRTSFVLLAALSVAACAFAAEKPRALIIDGQNNHQWQQTTPVLKKILEDSHVFATIDIVTAPPGPDMSAFHPDFAAYD
ncbi:MAG TPA: hypothetical protein VMJ34_22210, partial [Bryobacteraceae bacterium]|nr:hypothetical protein [Bryobacteraceae bacterium]